MPPQIGGIGNGPPTGRCVSLVVWRSRDGSRPGLACSCGHPWRGAVEHRTIEAVAAAPSATGLLALGPVTCWRRRSARSDDVLLERQLVNFQLPLTSTGLSFLR
jgi:hypothetical protein